MADSIFEFGDKFDVRSPFGNWLLSTGSGTSQGEVGGVYVTGLKGPNVICSGGIYEYRIVGFNRTDFVLGEIISKVKWGYSIDGRSTVFISPRSESVAGRHEILMKWRVPRNVEGMHLKMYAWLPDQEIPVSTSSEIRVYPFLFHKYREKGRNAANNGIADDMCYGDGVSRTNHFRYTRAEVESLGLQMQITLLYNVSMLWASFRDMVASLFSIGELEKVALAMVARFKESSGDNFVNPVLTKYVLEHPDTIRFIGRVENGIRDKMKENRNDPAQLFDPRVYSVSELYGRPQFNTLADTFMGGLTICWNDTWSYEVLIERVDVVNSSYHIKYRIILYDHFGLDFEDLSEDDIVYNLEGFRSWFALQHIHNFRPFIATVEVVRTITYSL